MVYLPLSSCHFIATLSVSDMVNRLRAIQYARQLFCRSGVADDDIDLRYGSKPDKPTPLKFALIDSQDDTFRLLHGGADGCHFGIVVVADISIVINTAFRDNDVVELESPDEALGVLTEDAGVHIADKAPRNSDKIKPYDAWQASYGQKSVPS